MAERKREDPATLGDLQDLAEQMRGGVSEALNDVLGKVIPGPPDKGEGGSGGDSGGSDGGSGGGSGGGGSSSDFGFGGRWWGGNKS